MSICRTIAQMSVFDRGTELEILNTTQPIRTFSDGNKRITRQSQKQCSHAALITQWREGKLSSLLHWDKERTSYGLSHRARQKKTQGEP